MTGIEHFAALVPKQPRAGLRWRLESAGGQVQVSRGTADGKQDSSDRPAIVLPLRKRNIVFGVLLLEPATAEFNTEEVGMITTLADDVSWAVTALRTRSGAHD